MSSHIQKQNFNNFIKLAKDFIKAKPLLSFVLIIVFIMLSSWILSSFELLPEFPKLRKTQSVVVEKGDSYDWIGMQVSPITRSIRKEFNIPKRIKGMFVLDEGIGSAKQCGVKTGDIIVSICRKPVKDAAAFINIANTVQYYEGISLDIYRDKNNLYVTIPFEYRYGPIYGPNKGSWQFGSPLLGQAFSYGPVVNNNRTR